jgi:ankyrin repeat protein
VCQRARAASASVSPQSRDASAGADPLRVLAASPLFPLRLGAQIIETAREQRGNLLTVRLCSACAAGDLVRIQRLLATSQLDVNRGDYDRRTPLHLAASRGHIKAVHLLLASHADANARDRAERTPLSEAQTSRNGEMLRLLLRFGAEMQTSGMADLLCAAAARADGLEELSFLIKGGTDPSIATEFDARTALHVAASCGHLPQVRLLIEVPASLNAVDLHDSTPLHDAFVHGHDDCSQLLLAAGAHMGRFDAARALCDAAGQNDVELIRRILAHGCDVNAENYDGRTALHVAAASHQLAAATLLLSVKGLVFNHEDRYGETPLDDAQRNPSELRSVVVSLIEAFGGRLGSHKLRPSAERAAAEQHKAMKDLAHVELLRTLLLKAKRCVLWVVGQLAAAKQLYIATHEALRLEMSKGMVLDFERPDYLVSVVEFAIGHRARQQFVTSFMRPLIELWQGQSDQYGSLKLELYKRVELLAEQQADVTVALQSLSETVFRSKEQAERERLKAEVEEGATKGRITNRNSKK